ncbi:MAG: bifunctional demethylmenaquinone methyltransferase/2-methoxy-6-polyprenyl-1,4-benzoquinol methylase UbiE [Coriobacteriia bacterium]|nr:bifunctional demethylmenaquinone methyltransferase/2-methoxy-6-polyprenyl-1,4-benzoquinol methylase UbiE [Coriobacteriia bacterium]
MTEPGEEPKTPAAGEATAERVHGIFSGIADSYDLFNRLSSLGVDRSWRKTAVEAAHLGHDCRVLDICAGTGDLTFELARRAEPAEVVCTDFVAEMLVVAEKKAARYTGPTKLTFSVVDAQELPFSDESFDAVTVAFGVRNLPDRAANFSEVMRILKPGGRYVVLEFSRPPFWPWRLVYHFYLRTVIPTLGAVLTRDRGSFQYLDDSILRFPDQVSLAAELRAAGFSAITWKNLTGGIVAVHTAAK